MTLVPYTWRGRTYKTLDGLCRAVMRAHPHSSVGFDAAEMRVRDLRTGEVAVYSVTRNHPTANEVADQPIQ